MNERDSTTRNDLRRISEMSGYKVAPGEPDIRGWTVIDANGQPIGEVDDLFVNTAEMKVRDIDVDVRGGGHVTVSAAEADVDRERKQVRIPGYSGATMTGRATSDDTRGDRVRERALGATEQANMTRDRTAGTLRDRDVEDTQRLTRAEEEVRVGKREVSGGEAVIGKHVETEHVRQPVTLKHEELVIERRPITNKDVPADTAFRDGEIHVPLRQEEPVIEKHAVAKEEIVIGKRVVEETKNVETDVRREEFDLDRSRRDRGPKER